MSGTASQSTLSLVDLPGLILLGAFVFSIPSIYYNSELVEQGQRAFQVLAVLAIGANLHHLSLARLGLPVLSLVTLWVYFSITALFSHDSYLTDPFIVWGKFTAIACLLSLVMAQRAHFFAVMIGLAGSAIFVAYSSHDSLVVARESLIQATAGGESTRVSGVFTNANLLGMYGVDAILAAVILYFCMRSWSMLVLGVASGAAAAYLAFFSGSRKAMLGLGFIVLFVLWLSIKNRRSSGLVTKIVGACIVVAGILWILNSPYLVRFRTGEESYQVREELAQEAWKYINASPFWGLGYRGFELTSVSGAYTHSTPLEVICNGGIFGLGIYMLFWWGLFRSLIRSLALEMDERGRLLLYGIVCYCGLQIINSLASVVIEEPRYLVVAACICGYLRTREVELGCLGQRKPLQTARRRGAPEFGTGVISVHESPPAPGKRR